MDIDIVDLTGPTASGPRVPRVQVPLEHEAAEVRGEEVRVQVQAADPLLPGTAALDGVLPFTSP